MKGKVKKIVITGTDDKGNKIYSQNVYVSHIHPDNIKLSLEFEGGEVKDVEFEKEEEEKDEVDKGDKE